MGIITVLGATLALVLLVVGSLLVVRAWPDHIRTVAGRAPTAASARGGSPAGTDGATSVLAGNLTKAVVTPGTGLLAGWSDWSGLQRGTRDDGSDLAFCKRPLPHVPVTEAVKSIGVWAGPSKDQPQGETLRDFGQALNRTGADSASRLLAAMRTSITACTTYVVEFPPPNRTNTKDTFTIQPDLGVRIGDESVGVRYHDMQTSKALGGDTYLYLIAFRVGDVLGFTSGSSGIELSAKDLDLIRAVALEEVRRLTGRG